MTSQTVPHRRRPCRDCPYRTDTVGRKAYSNITDYAEGTIGQPGAEAPLGAPMFACHMSRTDPGELCAGWLAVAGYEHLTVRYAIITGALPATVLQPGPSWPDLFESGSDMITTHQACYAQLTERPGT